MSKGKKKGDLFGFLDAMNRGDFSFVDKMSDDDVKGLSPFVLLMWINGATSSVVEHNILTDTHCNDKVFSLSKHPRLLLKLLIAANEGNGNTRFEFKKSTSKEQSAVIRDVAEHYQVTNEVAKQYIELLPEEDIQRIKEIYN